MMNHFNDSPYFWHGIALTACTIVAVLALACFYIEYKLAMNRLHNEEIMRKRLRMLNQAGLDCSDKNVKKPLELRGFV
jgi:hypothetical protein